MTVHNHDLSEARTRYRQANFGPGGQRRSRAERQGTVRPQVLIGFSDSLYREYPRIKRWRAGQRKRVQHAAHDHRVRTTR